MKYREALQRTADDAARVIDEGVEGPVRADEFVDDYRETASRLAGAIHEGLDRGEAEVVRRDAMGTASTLFCLGNVHPTLQKKFIPPAGLEIGAAGLRMISSDDGDRPKDYWTGAMKSGYYAAYGSDSLPDVCALALDFEQTDAYPVSDSPDAPPVREYTSDDGVLASVPWEVEARMEGLMMDLTTGEAAVFETNIPHEVRRGFTNIERYRWRDIDEEELPKPLRDRDMADMDPKRIVSDADETGIAEGEHVELAYGMVHEARVPSL